LIGCIPENHQNKNWPLSAMIPNQAVAPAEDSAARSEARDAESSIACLEDVFFFVIGIFSIV
jgi:hypothetical protein